MWNIQIKTINYHTHNITLPTTLQQALLLPEPVFWGSSCLKLVIRVILIFVHYYTAISHMKVPYFIYTASGNDYLGCSEYFAMINNATLAVLGISLGTHV